MTDVGARGEAEFRYRSRSALVNTSRRPSPRSIGAALAIVALGALVVPSVANGAPKVSITTFDADRTILPGRTASVTPFCRRGFALLSTGARPISSSPSGPGNIPRVATRGVVPFPKGATFTFSNVGTTTVVMRAQAHCVKIRGSGKRARGGAGGAGTGARARRGSGPDLDTKIATQKDDVERSDQPRNETVRERCTPRNSIPGGLGFKSKHSDLRALRFFEQGGDIGLAARFRVKRADELRLHLICVQGDGIDMKGKLAAGAARGPAGVEEKRGRQRRIVVSYRKVGATSHPDVPLIGIEAAVNEQARSYWMNPAPAEIPADRLLMGWGILDPAQFKSGVVARGPSGEHFGYALTGLRTGSALNAPAAMGGRPRELIFLFGHLLDLDNGDPDPDDDRPGDVFTGGGTTKCSNGIDDADAEDADADASDVGCLTGPLGAHNPSDTLEDDISTTHACPDTMGQITTSMLTLAIPPGQAMNAHVFRAITAGKPGTVVNRRQTGDVDFSSGMTTLPGFCSSGTTTTLSWSSNATSVSYTTETTAATTASRSDHSVNLAHATAGL